MSDMQANDRQQELIDHAVAEGGAYEILQKRLAEQGRDLHAAASSLNQQRLAEFGSSQLEISARLRIRSENNCLARDIVRVGSWLLFGYNVFIGLKKETQVSDVFSLYQLVETEEGFDVEAVDLQHTFLAIPRFQQDFSELYTYYKNTRLLQLVERDGKLLASFQIGERISDVRVFRWSISSDRQTVEYIDNRGERDIALPSPYDFEWQRATRENSVSGRFAHMNILDSVFVETLNGNLTVKVENNTEDGLGIYHEPVVDKNQSLDDAQFEYARVGSLILLKILPYREESWRYLVFNTLTQSVIRIDAIGQACIQLPEDHGIIFPGGCYLQNGEYKTFEQPMSGMRFRRIRRSPNGEDVLYIFYSPEEGRLALFNYNMIRRQLMNPIYSQGYAVMEDGRMVIFAPDGAESGEPTRIHPMQLWQTPYYTEEFAARQPARNSFMGRIGNAELVRGISDLYHIAHVTASLTVSSQLYEKLSADIRRLFDSYHWLMDKTCQETAQLLRDLTATSEHVLDEFQKAEEIRRQSFKAIAEAQTRQRLLLNELHADGWNSIQQYTDALNALTAQQGLLITLRDYRYIDPQQLAGMENSLKQRRAEIADATARFLATPQALQPYQQRLRQLDEQVQQAGNASQMREPVEQMEQMSRDLDFLSNLMMALKFEDVTEQTRIVESISELYARLNQTRVRSQQRRKEQVSHESVAQFGAQFKLFGQSISGALALATDPELCDEQLSALLIQLEELESGFSEHEGFLSDIFSKREELLETFASHKQTLQDDRQRKTQALLLAADRILESLPRRVARLSQTEELNAFFAADPLALKVRDIAERLRTLKDSVKADDLEARFKAAKDGALRTLRDKSDLFESGGSVIRLGPRHRFSVNTQELDLTLLPHGDRLYIHLTGTDFRQPLHDETLQTLSGYWQHPLESESAQLYRAEFLAMSMLRAASRSEEDLTLDRLKGLLAQPDALVSCVRNFAASRYKEGYEKGIHDHDAAAILQCLIPAGENAALLRYNPRARALALLFWQRSHQNKQVAQWTERARTSLNIQQLFNSDSGMVALQQEIREALNAFYQQLDIPFRPYHFIQGAEYLSLLLSQPPFDPVFSKYARQLQETLHQRLEQAHMWGDYRHALDSLKDNLSERWRLAENWLLGLCSQPEFAPLSDYIPEAVALDMLHNGFSKRFSEVDLRIEVPDLLGDHPRIQQRTLTFSVDDIFGRARYHRKVFIPEFQRYQAARQNVIQQQRSALRLDEFKPRPLSSFVRNRLIDELYLPVIGDNLAKQMGTVGENKRTDLMGLLLMISPPGYGKTTLMEYVAHRLGLIFMKINGPALGHSVLSLDPQQAPDATARQELEKVNLALEMGNNVMLYLDDIQHTHPEFLQKFISLCDGTRRIEGVWQGKTRTYDLRGKKFCVVMAGNPYTESGEVFRIPDMLANRADIYNLGEVLGGKEEVFALSYIENCLTSNPLIAPLALREMRDLYSLIDRAQGKTVSSNELSYPYTDAEIRDITALLQHLITLRDTVLKVNQHYIASAAQADSYRSEPPFRLQGSYRNMNKLAEKVSAVMNAAEIEQILYDHYLSEAQLLTSGAEENLLKLAEIRGVMNAEQQQRWRQIKRDFMRNKSLGGGQGDVGSQIVTQLADLVESVKTFRN